LTPASDGQREPIRFAWFWVRRPRPGRGRGALVPAPDGLEARVGEAGSDDLLLGHRRSELHQRLGIGVGQAAKKDRAHDAEDRGRRADAQGQSERRDGQEPGRAEQWTDSLLPESQGLLLVQTDW